MNTTNTTGRLPGAVQVSKPKGSPVAPSAQATKTPNPAAQPTLLDLARKLDRTPVKQAEPRIAIGETMKALLGTRYEEFGERFEKLHDAAPAFPWPAEAVALCMQDIPDPTVSDNGAFGMMKCGCAVAIPEARPLTICDFHQEVVNEVRNGFPDGVYVKSSVTANAPAEESKVP